MSNYKLLLSNEFILGPTSCFNRREGGIRYMSEKNIGSHSSKTRIALSLLRSSLYDGFSLKYREKEKEFLKRSGKELCEFLGLNYEATIRGINLTWNKYDKLLSNET